MPKVLNGKRSFKSVSDTETQDFFSWELNRIEPDVVPYPSRYKTQLQIIVRRLLP